MVQKQESGDRQEPPPGENSSIFERDQQSRRDFVVRAGKFAAGGLAAGVIFDGLTVNPLLAQQAQEAPKTPRPAPSHPVKRVAVIGAGHYHATAAPGYLKILQNLHLDIVGVHDPNPAIAQNRASLVGSTPYTDYRQMVEKTKPDFVLSLNRHVDMPGPIRFLINAGVPFMAEKPWGIHPQIVNGLAELAEKKNAWATAPFSMRYTWWAQTARKMIQSGEPGVISHMLVRFNQPGVQRYVDEGSAWMLSKKEAGGGCLINLGDHGFDLCYYVTGQTPKVLSAVTNHSFFNLDIEDYAFVTTRAPNGMIFLNEAGYTFPTQGSDSENTIAAKKAQIRSAGFNGVEVIGPGVHQQLKPPAGYKSLWVGAVADAIDRLGRGEPPAVTARDLARAVSLVFDSYKMAGEAT